MYQAMDNETMKQQIKTNIDDCWRQADAFLHQNRSEDLFASVLARTDNQAGLINLLLIYAKGKGFLEEVLTEKRSYTPVAVEPRSLLGDSWEQFQKQNQELENLLQSRRRTIRRDTA